MTPACCCGERKLQASLKVIHGWPVSKSMVNIFRHKSLAGILLCLISPAVARASSAVYADSNSSPQRSCSIGESLGENNVHRSFSITRFINKSGTQLAVFISCARRRSSPVFCAISQKFRQIHVPSFQIRTNRPLALTALIDRNGDIIDDFQNGITPCDEPLVPLM